MATTSRQVNDPLTPQSQLDLQGYENMATNKQYQQNLPAFSSHEIYELIHGKKPRGKVQRKWRKLNRLLFRSSSDDWTGSNTWHIVGYLSFILALIPWVPPLQLGAALFFYLFLISKADRNSYLFNLSGVSAILLAVVIPMLVLNTYSAWQASLLYLPAHFAMCSIAALYRSDENLDVSYVIQKALSYLVFTFMTGWLSLYVLTNI